MAEQNWPEPGDEGYVTPEDTPQAHAQLAENRWAAEDRKRAGSGVHGAPAQGGVVPELQAAPAEAPVAPLEPASKPAKSS